MSENRHIVLVSLASISDINNLKMYDNHGHLYYANALQWFCRDDIKVYLQMMCDYISLVKGNL